MRIEGREARHARSAIVAAAALAAALPCAARARSYDCAAASSGGGAWLPTPAQTNQLLADWTARAAFHAEHYMPRYCGVIEKGERLIMIGALHIVGDFAICDDPANFAVYYHPATRQFGRKIPGQTFCALGRKLPRPTLQ